MHQEVCSERQGSGSGHQAPTHRQPLDEMLGVHFSFLMLHFPNFLLKTCFPLETGNRTYKIAHLEKATVSCSWINLRGQRAVHGWAEKCSHLSLWGLRAWFLRVSARRRG